MCQNIKYKQVWLIASITMFVNIAFEGSLLAASAGSELARTALSQSKTLTSQYVGASTVRQRDDALQSLRNETSAKLSRLTEGDRVDYVEDMANELAKIGTGQEDNDLSGFAMMFITAGTSLEEIADGSSRLLSSENQQIRETGEGLLRQGSVKLPNGQTGQDISVFNLALNDPKVPQDRLIGTLFKLAPVESVQWFADHAGLPADERAGLESDLGKAWQLHRAVNDPSVDPDTKSILDDKIKKPLLDHWLHSPSWILQMLAKGFLEQSPSWQTPDLKVAMQNIAIPKKVELKPSATPTTTKTTTTPQTSQVTPTQSLPTSAPQSMPQVTAPVVEKKSTLWPQLIGVSVLALVVIGLLVWKSRS